jgi:hypothetical protein
MIITRGFWCQRPSLIILTKNVSGVDRRPARDHPSVGVARPIHELAYGWSLASATERMDGRGGGSPHHYPARSLGLGVCLSMATHYNHTTRASITSKHVPIVERLVGRHSPTQMGVSGLASRPEPWRPIDNTTRTVIKSKHESIVESRRGAMQAAITLPVDSFRLASPEGHGDSSLHYEHVDYESTCIDCRRLPLGQRSRHNSTQSPRS